MMLLRARDNNIQSFAYTWLHKGNQNEFLKYPKIKWLDGGLKPPTSGLPVHCSIYKYNQHKYRKSTESRDPSNHLIFGCLRNSF